MSSSAQTDDRALPPHDLDHDHFHGDHDEKRMPFLEHLGELRDRIRNAAIAVFICTVICYIYRLRLFGILAGPIMQAFEQAKALGVEGKLIYISPIERFMVFLKTAVVAGIFLSSPALFHQLWAFIAPGLHKHEKRWALPFVLVAVLLFVGGGYFCFRYVLPAGYVFFVTTGLDASELREMGPGSVLFTSIQPFISLDEYYSLTLMLLLVFGTVFELPLILSVLAMLGVVSASSLWRWNRYAILLFTVAGAVLTPGDLVVGQLALAGSLTVLYNLSIVVAWLVQRKRKPAESEPTDSDPPPPAASDTGDSSALVKNS